MMKRSTARALAAAAAPVAALALSSLAGPAGAEPGRHKEIVPVHSFADGTQITGAFSTLTRTDDAIATTVRTRDQAGHAYTTWYVIFNDPTQCNTTGCGADDLFVNGDMTQGFNAAGIAAARISVVWGNAGGVANPGGRVNLSGGIAEGAVPAGPNTVVIGLDEDGALAPEAATGAVVTGLEDARAAEVHVIVQTHGAAHDDPALLEVQLSQFQGACNPSCQDVQFAIHLP